MGSVATGLATGIGSTVAGGAVSSILGDDGGGGNYKRKRDSRYTPAQQKLINKLAGQVHGEIGEGIDAYPGSVVPEPTEGQKMAQEMGQTFLGQKIPALAQRGEDLLQREDWDPSRSRERWKQTVMQPAQEQFQEEMAPAIMEKFGSRNALSSSALNEAMGEASEDVQTSAMRKLADMTYQDYTRHQQEQMNRAQMGQSMLGQALQQAGMAPNLGGLREIERQEAVEEKQKWQTEQPYANPWLPQAGTVLGTQPVQTSYVSQAPGAGSQLASQLGGQLTQFGASKLGSTLGSMGGGGAPQPNYGSGSFGISQGQTVNPGMTAPYGVGG